MKGLMTGKVALITGGGTGLGAAVARRFSRSGASVVVTGRREDPIKKIAAETGGKAVVGDVTDSDHLSRAVDLAIKEFGGLDVVIANAGIISMADVVSVEDKDWQQMVDINLTGVMKTAQAAIPTLIARGGGSIVNIASVAGLMGVNEGVGYCTTKSALLGLTRSLAMDYGPKGIRVNTLCPGWFRSEMSEMEMVELAKEKNVSVGEAVARVTQYLPLKRMAEPDEIAACVEFLASDNASFVTGTVLVADGGGAIVDVGMLGFL
ncbi:SDR family oxidoreductase [bacterium]|nr:SDR family oxidoreductase [bacterium]